MIVPDERFVTMAGAKKDLILRSAVETWGEDAQVDIAIEEMAELTKALLKVRRFGKGEALTDSVLEEMADVQIMLWQLYLIYGEPHGEETFKLIRLGDRLAREGVKVWGE